MRNPPLLRLMLLIVVVAGPPLCTGMAAAEVVAESVGTIYLSASTTNYDPNPTAGSFTPFELYVVAEIDFADIGLGEQNLTNGISAWEGFASIPSEIIVTQVFLNPEGAQNQGQDTNWIVDLGSTALATSSPIILATLTGLITNPVTPENLVLVLGPSTPSSLSPPQSGFREVGITNGCTDEAGDPVPCWRPFAEVKGATVNCVTNCMNIDCGGFSPCPPVESMRWGALKGTYFE